MPCEKVKPKAISFNFRIFDHDKTKFEYQVPFHELYVSGEKFGETANTCFIPIFDHGIKDEEQSNLVMIGNLFMDKYYFVYD